MRGCFVEASAGTGKTTELVNAIAEALANGIRVDRIAAVTFTHQAAGEMKLRVRQNLEDLRTPVTSEALQHLDRAFIGTIHAFCANLLRQRPVEACVDPGFVELDQGQARRLFGRVFGSWIARRVDTPSPVLRRALARLAWRDNLTGPVAELEAAAWKLAEWRDQPAPWDKRPIAREARVAELLTQARSLVEIWPTNEATWARRILFDIVERFERAKAAGVFEHDDAESEIVSIRRRLRNAKLSKRTSAGQAWTEFQEAVKYFAQDADADLASHLRDELWDVVEAYQETKRESGYLDFTDLLLYARDLLRHDGARPEIQARYDRIFVDEFQDTDPLQAEILTTLASSENLFVVGDPKQSIYRFRRAEPRIYFDVRERLLSEGAEERLLGKSYRSTDPIQAFVNAAFAPVIPGYLPLSGGPPGPDGQPSIVALPMPRPYEGEQIKPNAILECSPSAVAAFIQWLLKSSGWTVREDKKGNRRPMKAEDICILFRRFIHREMGKEMDLTQDYVRSLEARKIEHVLIGSKGLHKREETAAIRTALRAIEWPDDELSVYAVLHGPLFGIDAATLLRFKEQHGRFRPFAEPPNDADPEFEPIWQAFAILRELHRKRNHLPIAETIRATLDAVRGHASIAFHNGGPRHLANLHRVAELARQADTGGRYTFRAFGRWLEEEARSGESAEAPVLEQQANGVRIINVHKAKGLEFPVVILADLSAGLTGVEGCDRWVATDRSLCAQRLLRCAPWELIDHQAEEVQAEREEAARVAYVAATRAKDLLVVCALGDTEYEGGWLQPLYDALYPPKDRRRKPEISNGDETVLNAPVQPKEEQIRPGVHRPKLGNHRVLWFDPKALDLKDPASHGAEREHLLDGTRAQIEEGLARYSQWRSARAHAIESASIPAFVVRLATEATSIPEAASIPVELIEVEVDAKVRGRRFGKLVHAVLQSGGGAAAHGRRWNATPEEVRAADEIARVVLAHPLVAPVPGREIFREMPVIVKLDDGTIIEGRIDLAWTDAASWTVIDYKTDSADRDRYKRQLQLYALALQRATGKPARGILLEIG
ncbi:MAG: UvrD-helicase domain-containing protein [Bryobacteraceae bacterium]